MGDSRGRVFSWTVSDTQGQHSTVTYVHERVYDTLLMHIKVV